MQPPGQVQQGSGEGSERSGEGLEGFGAEPGQVQQGSREGSEEGLGGFLVQSQVRCNGHARIRKLKPQIRKLTDTRTRKLTGTRIRKLSFGN